MDRTQFVHSLHAALTTLLEAERIASETLGGMQYDAIGLDLEAPATIGALLALLREARGDGGIRTRRTAMDPETWSVLTSEADDLATVLATGPIEGDAVAAALIAEASA